MEQQGVCVSREDIRSAYSVLRSSTAVAMCRNLIRNYLFSNGIVFSHRRGRVKPDPHMQEIMNDYWLPFCEQALDAVLAIGIVVVRFIDIADAARVPVVLEPNSVQIKLLYQLGLRSYEVLDEQMNLVPDTLVLDLFGYSPTMEGRVQSMVCTLMPEIQYINILRGTSLSMEQQRANPPILTEVVDTKIDNSEGVQYDFYADGDMQDNSDANKFRRNRSNISQLKQQQAMYDSFFSGDSRTPSRGGDILENVVTLPIGQKAVGRPAMTGRADLVVQIKNFQDIVCGVMGVPRSLIMADTRVGNDEDGTHQTFHKTILWWKKNIQNACEYLYNIIYAEDIQGQLLKAMGKKRKRAGVTDVYALKKRLQVQIAFPITPFMSNTELYNHYQRGVIPWEIYVEHACKNTSLPLETMPPEPQTRDNNDSAGGEAATAAAEPKKTNEKKKDDDKKDDKDGDKKDD